MTNLGEARSPARSTHDIIVNDTVPAPFPLTESAPLYLGSEDLPYAEYTSPTYAQAEHDHMWGRVWQWACRVEHVAEPGDYYVYDIGDRSALIVHGDDGELRAFYNACLHRGTQLKPPGTCGWSKQLRCPFHGWTWSGEGNMVDLPGAWDFAHFEQTDTALPQLKLDTWNGFVFVNFDGDAAPLADYLGVLPDHFANWDLADKYIEIHCRKKLPANWKAAAEAFLEAYHILETHSQSVQTCGDDNAQYDVFGQHISRFIHTIATPSPHIPVDKQPSEQKMVDLLMGRKNPDGSSPTLAEGETARDAYSAWMQETMGERYGRDFSHLSTSETIDSIEYFAFPNAFFFPGLQFPMVYRFRPDGNDVDTSIFDMLVLRPNPIDGPPPPPAEPFDLDVDDSYTTTPGIQKSLGAVYDQDTSNLAAQTRGFRSSKKRGQTLGNYQEIRARHLHATVNAYIDGSI